MESLNFTVFFNFLSVMKTLLYFKNRIQTAVNPINVGLTAVFIFFNCQRRDYITAFFLRQDDVILQITAV